VVAQLEQTPVGLGALEQLLQLQDHLLLMPVVEAAQIMLIRGVLVELEVAEMVLLDPVLHKLP
jgi:hypothetical protein